MTTNFDAVTAAAEAANTNERFGQAFVEVREVRLAKGLPKEDWDAERHDSEHHQWEITIRVDPLPEMGLTFFDRKEMIAGFGDFPWKVWPTLKALGVKNVGELHEAWVRYEMVPNGRKYTKRDTGEQRDELTFKFLEIYQDEDTCRMAYGASRGEVVHSTPSDDNGAGEIDMSHGAGSVDNNDVERETARQFLQVLVNQHRSDRDALAKALAGMPMVSKYFTIDSPEVVQMLEAA